MSSTDTVARANTMRDAMDAAWEREAATMPVLKDMPELYVGLIRAAFNRGYLVGRDYPDNASA